MSDKRNKTKFHQTLKVDGQQKNLMAILNKQRESGTLCDAILVAEGRHFPVHRAVLSASSEYFEKLLGTNFVEKDRETIETEDVEADILKTILNCIYTGELVIETHYMVNLAATCNYFLLTEFLITVKKYALIVTHHENRDIRLSNILQVRKMANMYDWDDIMDKCDKQIQDNFTKICAIMDWDEVSFEELLGLLKREDINTKNEDCFIDAVLNWLNCEMEARSMHMNELMNYVRFPLLSPEKQMELKNNKLILNSDTCKQWLHEATHFYLSTCDRQTSREREQMDNVVNADGIKYRPRQTLDDTIIYALVNWTDLRAYFPKYDSWYCLSLPEEPAQSHYFQVSNVSGSVFYAMHYDYEEDDHNDFVEKRNIKYLQQYDIMGNIWKSIRAPSFEVQCMVNCHGTLITFTTNAVYTYNPNVSWKKYDTNLELQENDKVTYMADGRLLIYDAHNFHIEVLDESDKTFHKTFQSFINSPLTGIVEKDFLLNLVQFLGLRVSATPVITMLLQGINGHYKQQLRLPKLGIFSWECFKRNCETVVDRRKMKVYMLGKLNENLKTASGTFMAPFIEMTYNIHGIAEAKILASLVMPKSGSFFTPIIIHEGYTDDI